MEFNQFEREGGGGYAMEDSKWYDEGWPLAGSLSGRQIVEPPIGLDTATLFPRNDRVLGLFCFSHGHTVSCGVFRHVVERGCGGKEQGTLVLTPHPPSFPCRNTTRRRTWVRKKNHYF